MAVDHDDSFVEALRLLKDRKFGWIRPDGTLAVVPLHEHFNVLRQEPAFASLIERMDALKMQEREEHQEFVDCHEDSDHVPWHAYYSDTGHAADLLRTRILASAYAAGWTRVGMYPRRLADMRKQMKIRNKREPGDCALEFEGTAEGLAAHERLAGDISSALRMAYVLTETDALRHSDGNDEFNAEHVFKDALRKSNAETSGVSGLTEWRVVDDATFEAHQGPKRRKGDRCVIITTTPWGDPLPAVASEASSSAAPE